MFTDSVGWIVCPLSASADLALAKSMTHKEESIETTRLRMGNDSHANRSPLREM